MGTLQTQPATIGKPNILAHRSSLFLGCLRQRPIPVAAAAPSFTARSLPQAQASRRRSVHHNSAKDWFQVLGLLPGQRRPVRETILESDSPQEIRFKMSEIEKTEAAAAAAEQKQEQQQQQQQQQQSPTSAQAQANATSLKRSNEDAPVSEPQDSADADNSSPSKQAKRARFGDRRDRRGTRNVGTSGADDGGAVDAGSGEGRLPKRKVAVKFGYCGIGYSGLQINPGVKTIEGDIFDAFCRAGAVSKDNAVNPNKVGLQRAARTDRGVHAAGNLLSLKLILEPAELPQGQNLIQYVNTLLPPIIRIWGITRVQNSFNARTSCDSRMYEYLLPTYVFLPPKPQSAMWTMLQRMNDEHAAKNDGKAPESLAEILDHPFWREQGTKHDFSTDVRAKKAWRMPVEHVDCLRAIFNKYAGSHNFHNFTIGKDFRDRSAQRFMKRLTISDPFLVNDTEWVSIKFHGQSFMLHQIRKMIGLLVLVGRTNAPASLIPETFGPARIHIPKAPGLGLLLEEPLFGAYNSRVASSNNRVREDEKRDPVAYEEHKSLMQEFKQTYIYDRIMLTEEETFEFAKWLNYLDVFQGPDFEFLNPKGIIPTAAILKVGELRRAPGGQLKGSFGGGTTDGKAEQDGAAANSDADDDDDEKAFLSAQDQAEFEG